MNIDWLKMIQRSGWRIESAGRDDCTALCPTPGCKMRARFKSGASIPVRDVPLHSIGRASTNFDEAREVLKERRQELGLTIAEVEHIAGIAGDHLAKFERTDWSRPPGISIFLEWCQALGIEVILRPADLPPVTLRWIAETRQKAQARRRRFAIERQRDAQRDGRIAR